MLFYHTAGTHMVKGHSIDSSLQPRASGKPAYMIRNLLSGALALIAIIGVVVATTYLFAKPAFAKQGFYNVLSGATAVYFFSNIALYKLGRHPGNRPISYLLPILAFNLLIFVAFINFFRVEYSRIALMATWFAVPLVTYLEFRFRQHLQQGIYAVLPFGFYTKLVSCNPDKFKVLEVPAINEHDFNGIIVDSNEKLPAQWQHFIAEQLSFGTPVTDSVSAYEAITGKSPLDHYGELATHDILPSQLYLSAKRLLESVLVIVSAPITLPLVLLVALLVKLESKGPAFFVQRRVGKGGREFSMYKIRSMRIDSEAQGAKFAGENDPRITRIGRFIRKMRIDELPQFINILKGDMALIGPRPEQATFVRHFSEVIPLYNFRHVVRPGITGWAQVTHGYAAGEDETREKLAHDFYYVKNLSLWLDIDIIFKTIKTMLTGFGAR